VPSAVSVGKKSRVQLPQCVTSEIGDGFVNYGTGQMDGVFREKFCVEQGGGHLIIAEIPAALADILHIAPFKDPFDDKVGFQVEVHLVIVYIPEDPSVKNRFWFASHRTKIINSAMQASQAIEELSNLVGQIQTVSPQKVVISFRLNMRGVR
jgi:hypothetical protein